MTLLAKSTGETLYEHSIKTYEYGMKIIDMLPYSIEERQELKQLASLPLLFHDIGKAAKGFQEALLKGTSWKGKRHEVLSSAFLGQFKLREEQIFAVLTHHKDIIDSKTDKTLPENQVEQYDGDTEVLKGMKQEFYANSKEIAILCRVLFSVCGKEQDFSTRLPEGIGLADCWIYGGSGSNDGQLKNTSSEARLLASKLRGIIKAADHLASSNTELVPQIDLKKFKITPYRLRRFQNRCKNCNGNMMLTAPTGSGKTEAVLLWAQHNQRENSRLFYVLPYQASINAMHKRLSKIFGKQYVGVLHSNSISYLYNIQGDNEDKIKNQRMAQEMSGLAHEIYYPIRVCTPHQLLRFGLKGKGWEYLFLEFSNSLVIYDEIHAFQPRITGLTLATAKLIKSFGAKIAFASATFQEFLKKMIVEKIGDICEIKPEKRYKTDKAIMEKKRHNIKILDGTLIENIEFIREMIGTGKTILIIANHVKTAQMVYEILKEYNPMLLHSRFNKRDRRYKEELLMSQAKPKVVIATQVIEVSLDIDYDMMFTEPAPIDALTQRFGRVNRKGEREQPAYIYVMKKQVSKHNLYNKERTEKTMLLLQNIVNPIGEYDLLNITNEVYKDGYTKDELEEFEQGYNNEGIQDFEKNLIAGVSRDWVLDVIDKVDGNCDALPIKYWNEFEDLMEKGLWIEANDLLVSVSYNMIRENIEKNRDVLIVNCMYDSERGLMTDEKPSNFDFD